jgi:hypothetical protein
MKKILFAAIALGLIGAGIGLYLKNKKVKGLEGSNPDFTITAELLYGEFSANEDEAVKKFNGKIVEVEGEIMDVQPVNDSTASLLLVADDIGLATIKCGLGKNYANEVQELQLNQSIKLKCICSGVTRIEDFMDIEMSRCVIVK